MDSGMGHMECRSRKTGSLTIVSRNGIICDTIFLMEINKEKLNRKRGWMDKKMGKTSPF